MCFILGALVGQQANPFDIPSKPNIGGIEDILPSESSGIANPTIVSLEDSIGEETPDIGINNPFDVRSHSSLAIENLTSSTLVNDETGLIPSSPSDTKVTVLVFFLGMLVILTLAIGLNRKRFGTILHSCINSNQLRTLYRDTKAWTNGQSIILYLFFFLSGAFVIWLLGLKIGDQRHLNLFIVLGSLIACYLIRHLVMWIISAIFPLGQEVELQNFSISVHNMILGVVLLPFALVIEFAPNIDIHSLLYGVAGIILIVYMLRQLKGLLLIIGMRGFNPFYFFIYLCAVEIAPILVAYRMMIGAL